jgi:hypothetical protein
MKSLLIIFSFLFALTSTGQDCQKKFSKNVDPFEPTKVNFFQKGGLLAISQMKMSKFVDSTSVAYYLSITGSGFLDVDGKGCSILFEDGSKLEFPNEKIDVEVNAQASYNFKAFVLLSDSDLAALKSKTVKLYRLNGMDTEAWKTTKQKIKEAANCIEALN